MHPPSMYWKHCTCAPAVPSTRSLHTIADTIGCSRKQMAQPRKLMGPAASKTIRTIFAPDPGPLYVHCRV